MTLHELLYSFELGKGKAWMNKLLMAMLIGALSLWYLVSEFHGFKEREAMDAAQVGRQIAEGRGFTTHWIRPQAMTIFEEKIKGKNENKLDSFPEIYQAPLYPYILGALFRVTGKPYEVSETDLRDSPFRAEWVISFFNVICTYFTGFLILILGARLFDARVGILSAALFLVSNLIWSFSISGLSTSFVILLLTASWLFFNEGMMAQERSNLLKLIGMMTLSGFLLGLSVLTRLSLIWILIPMLLLSGIAFRRRLWVLWIYGAAFALVVGPYLMRNQVVSGSIMGGWGSSHSMIDTEFRMLQSEQTFSYLKLVVVRMLQAAGHMIQNLQGILGGSFAAILGFAAIFHVFRRERVRIFQYGIFILIPFLILAGSFVTPSPAQTSVWNMVIFVLPLLIICGTAFFYILLDRVELPHPAFGKGIIGLFIFLNAIPYLLTLAPPKELPVRFPPYYPLIIKISSEWSESNEVIATDMPWATAWYGGRISLWLPLKINDLYRIHDYINPISAVLISPISLDQKISDLKSPLLVDYEKILSRSGMPANFPWGYATGLPPKLASQEDAYLYFSDSARWMKKKQP